MYLNSNEQKRRAMTEHVGNEIKRKGTEMKEAKLPTCVRVSMFLSA